MRDRIAKIIYETYTGWSWGDANDYNKGLAYQAADAILELKFSVPEEGEYTGYETKTLAELKSRCVL